jgi:acetylornithine deacetylase/succinyl-diaminopimelate desuccinylase-like protein
VGIYGGVKDGIKTIVPATATLKMVARLVPNQKPAEVLEVRSFVPFAPARSLSRPG